jgi:hypothetical protein
MKLLTGLTFSLLFATSAFAANDTGSSRTFQEPRFSGYEEQKPSIGVMGGYTDTEGSRDSSGAYSLELGFQPVIPVGMAIELGTYSTNGEGGSASLTRTKLLGKVNYNLGGTIPVIRYSYLGLGAGPVYDNVNHDTDWSLGIAPQAGFDIPVSSAFTLGANTSYMFISNAKDDVFALNAVAKYWY